MTAPLTAEERATLPVIRKFADSDDGPLYRLIRRLLDAEEAATAAAAAAVLDANKSRNALMGADRERDAALARASALEAESARLKDALDLVVKHHTVDCPAWRMKGECNCIFRHLDALGLIP
jgi:U3 small nucleolar ribonucleoprotein component